MMKITNTGRGTAFVKDIKGKAGYMNRKAMTFGQRLAVLATALVFAIHIRAYAEGESSLETTLSSSLQTISGKAIAALATIMAVASLITGAMSIYDMAQGSKSSNPEQQDKGQKSLVAAIGMALGAAALLGIKGVVNSFIQAALSA